MISSDVDLKKYMSKYYKNLFGPLETWFVSIDKTQMGISLKSLNKKNEILVQNFFES